MINQIKSISLTLCLCVLLTFTLGCSSYESKEKSNRSNTIPTNNMPSTPDNTTPGDTPPSGMNSALPALDVVVIHHLDARDRGFVEDYQNRYDCFNTNHVAIRFPNQSVSGREVIDWDLKCKYSAVAGYVGCSELVLGNKIPNEIGIDNKNNSVTFFYKDLAPGEYEFTTYASGFSGEPMSVESNIRFKICTENI